MNAPSTLTHELRPAPPSGLKLGTCAALSLIITLLTASVIGHATSSAALTQNVSTSASVLTASAR